MKPARIPGEYGSFLAEIRTRIQSARISVTRGVNRELVLLYWDLGKDIAEKQQALGWGQAVVELLSRDLQKAFPGSSSFSADNLWRMRQFYLAYSDSAFPGQAVPGITPARRGAKFLGQPVPEMELDQRALLNLLGMVPWGQNLLILKSDLSPAARLYYLRATVQCGWSRSVLLNQIKAGAWERAVKEKKTHNFELALPEHFAAQAEEMLKSRYNLEFLGIAQPMKERELEDRLIGRLQQFILELGYGFCFVGRQYRLSLGKKEYFVDLLFYHRFLKALVAFDLKLGEFEPEHAGKMDFYLNLLNEKERGPEDRPSIGIILCAEKDDVEVEFALKTKVNPIGVAEYQIEAKLPAEFKGRLPTARQLADAVREVLPVKRRGKPKAVRRKRK
jgi:predicted nuclease of restriction endonuclease-like (RecB) superfamily